MKWEEIHKDSGFILLMILLVLIWGWVLTGCSSKMCSSCPEEGHGQCPFNPSKCCNNYVGFENNHTH